MIIKIQTIQQQANAASNSIKNKTDAKIQSLQIKYAVERKFDNALTSVAIASIALLFGYFIVSDLVKLYQAKCKRPKKHRAIYQNENIKEKKKKISKLIEIDLLKRAMDR